jgi:hypothetical protein
VNLRADPPLDERDAVVVGRALELAIGSLATRSPAATSEWRRAAAREAVEGELEDARYAPSPRSTRGATRA